MVSVAVPPAGMVPGAKPFVIVGAAKTLSVAEAAAPEPALPVAIAPVELTYEPAAVAVTFTVTVQLADAGIVAPESAALAPPLAAVTVPPAHVVAPLAEAVLTRPAGYASVNAAPVMAVVLGFVSVMVSTDVAFGAIAAGVKDFAAVGAART